MWGKKETPFQSWLDLKGPIMKLATDASWPENVAAPKAVRENISMRRIVHWII